MCGKLHRIVDSSQRQILEQCQWQQTLYMWIHNYQTLNLTLTLTRTLVSCDELTVWQVDQYPIAYYNAELTVSAHNQYSPIKSNNKVLLTDIDKVQCLNNYFGSVFTVEKDGSIPISTSLYRGMPDIQVTTPGVLKLLSQLDVRKSMGPDGISPRILKRNQPWSCTNPNLYFQPVAVIWGSTTGLAFSQHLCIAQEWS